MDKRSNCIIRQPINISPFKRHGQRKTCINFIVANIMQDKTAYMRFVKRGSLNKGWIYNVEGCRINFGKGFGKLFQGGLDEVRI